MNKSKLISRALLDLAKASTTEIIENVNDELIEVAKKRGILLPSPDFAIIKTVYAEIDKANRNGVILPRKAVEEGLPTLIGKNLNWEHEGQGRICGYTIDAKIHDDKIEIIAVLFKSLFPEEMDTVKEKFESKELAVSFEIWTVSESGESVVEVNDEGYKIVNPIIFHGTGLLLTSKPACPKAKVYKLLAHEIDDKKFEENLIYAELAVEKSDCKKCDTCTCDKEKNKMDELTVEKVIVLISDYESDCDIEEAKKLTTEQRNALPDSDFALIQEKDGKKIRRFPINDEAHVRNALSRLPQAKDMTEEEKKETLKNILNRAKELKMEEIVKKYEKAEERLCPECQQPMKDDEQDICATCKQKKLEKSSEVVDSSVALSTEVVKPEDATVSVAPVTVEPAQVAEVQTEQAQTVATPEDTTKPEEVIAEPAKLVKIIVEEVVVTEKLPLEAGEQVSKKGYIRTTRYYSDERTETSEEAFDVVDKYTFAELEEATNKVKVEKDAEISTLKAEIDKIKAEKDTEVSTLKASVEAKDQEIATLKDKEITPSLLVGSVEKGKREDMIDKVAQKVRDASFRSR